mmetsp:Transcript_24440/g.45513  ORF Transcript_24440/g.45513 Transcript_24440/m.45513 type:complete len:259 (-) Transcript_24440:272-1048(-)
MSGLDAVPAVRQFDQLVRQTHINPLKRNLIDHQKQVGQPLGKGGKDKVAKGFRLCHQIVKHITRHGGGLHRRLGNPFGGIVVIGQQTRRGQDTAFARMQAIEHNLVAGLGHLLHPHRARQKKKHVFRRVAGAKNHCARRHLDDTAAGRQHGLGLRLEAGETGKPLHPFRFHIRRRHVIPRSHGQDACLHQPCPDTVPAPRALFDAQAHCAKRAKPPSKVHEHLFHDIALRWAAGWPPDPDKPDRAGLLCGRGGRPRAP